MATGVTGAAVFPVLWTALGIRVFGIFVALAALVSRSIGHIDHCCRQLIGHAIGNPQRRVVVHPDGLIVQHLVGKALGGADRKQCIGVLLWYGRRGLADAGNTRQRRSGGVLAGFVRFLGFLRLFLGLFFLVLLYHF